MRLPIKHELHPNGSALCDHLLIAAIDLIFEKPDVEQVREVELSLDGPPDDVPVIASILLELARRDSVSFEVVVRFQILLIASLHEELFQVWDHGAVAYKVERAPFVGDYCDVRGPVLAHADDVEVDELALEHHLVIAHRRHAHRVVKHAKFCILFSYQSLAEWHEEHFARIVLACSELPFGEL